MADSKVSALSALITPTSDDLLYVVDDPGGTPVSKKATIANVSKAIVSGSNTQVQFNDGGVFGGNSNFIYDKTTGELTVIGAASSFPTPDSDPVTISMRTVGGGLQIPFAFQSTDGVDTYGYVKGDTGGTVAIGALNILALEVGGFGSSFEVAQITNSLFKVETGFEVVNGITILDSGAISTDGTGQLTAVFLGVFGDSSGSTRLEAQNTASGTLFLPSADDTLVAQNTTDTLTNKRITKRVVTASDATSITPNTDNADITYQANTQALGTLTINSDSGTRTNGQSWALKIKSTNIQTFSWNALYVGGTIALPTATTGGSKIDYFTFIYDTVNSKWQFTGQALGF